MLKRSANTFNTRTIVILYACLLQGAFFLFHQDDLTAGTADPKSSQLNLTAEIEKKEFILGEPVYIAVQLRNTGNKPIKVARILHPQAGTIQVNVAKEKHPPQHFSPLFYADVTAPFVELGHEEEITAIIPIFFGSQGWVFNHPGQYTLSAIYHDPTKKKAKPLHSESIAISVLPGSGAGKLLMNESKESHEAGKFILWRQGDHLREGVAHLKEIVKQHPESPISDVINLALGSNLTQPFRDYSVNEIRQPNFPEALLYLDKVRDANLPRYLQIQKNLDQARCLFSKGAEASAKNFILKAKKLSSGKNEYLPLLDKAKRLEPRLKHSL